MKKTSKLSKASKLVRPQKSTKHRIASVQGANLDLYLKKYKKYITVKYIVVSSVAFLFLFLAGFSIANSFIPMLLGTSSVTMNVASVSGGDIANQDGTEITTDGQKVWVGTGRNRDLSYLGLRFSGNGLPADAVVNSARLVFTSPTNQRGVSTFTVYAEKSSSPAPYSTSNPPSLRVKTTASRWIFSSFWWGRNSEYSYDITRVVTEAVRSGGNGNVINILVKGYGQSNNRKLITTSGSTPKLVITYTTGSTNPTPTPTPWMTPTPIPTTFPTIIPTPWPTMIPTPTPIITVMPSMPMPTPTPGQPPVTGNVVNSAAFGIWVPTSQDTCTVADHDSFNVIGPDGRRYPTWHPPVMTKSNGSTCKFGHEHGRDPKSYPDYQSLVNHFAYDANKNGTIDADEKAVSGIPFGYVNEQMDVFEQARGSTVMRHEDHVGHKVEWEAPGDLFVHGGPGDFSNRRSVAKCNYFAKVHQGTHSKDAFTNNLHEVIGAINCPTENYNIIIEKMVAFGKPGIFAGSPPCDPRGGEVKVGTDSMNSRYPSGPGTREIGVRSCVESNFLVPNGRFSTNFYEIWIGDTTITAAGGKALVRNPFIQFASFNPIRYYYPGRNEDNLGYTIDLCYETEANGDKARGQPCDQLNGSKPAWDSPNSIFTDTRRETYFSASLISNAGGPTIWYSDPYGNNAKNAPFTGSLKQYIINQNVDPGQKYSAIVDTSAYGANRSYGGNGVHAPN